MKLIVTRVRNWIGDPYSENAPPHSFLQSQSERSHKLLGVASSGEYTQVDESLRVRHQNPHELLGRGVEGGCAQVDFEIVLRL